MIPYICTSTNKENGRFIMNNDKVVGLKFEDLSEEQMTHIAGGNGNERITPTITVPLSFLN